MNGSGLGNFGFGSIGILGQQPWQEEARRKVFTEAYARSLGAQVTNPANASLAQREQATAYATSMLPLGATLGGGVTVGGNPRFSPYAGSNLPMERGGTNWWNQNQTFRFPF